jgi:cyclic pyranopterin phosphate synthase
MATRTAARNRPPSLTHLDTQQRPAMVGIGLKAITHRVATAEAVVHLPAIVARALKSSGHRTAKGPVFDTAIVAGVMAAKRTSELIPFCHPLALEQCQIEIRASGNRLRVRCRVEVHHKTGVEMEALTGASIAALTIYDMCKSLSHDIEIGPVRLLMKRGWQTHRRQRQLGMTAALYGLVLAGGRSRRMQRDKVSLEYNGASQLSRAMGLLQAHVTRSFVSVRADQLNEPSRASYETIVDTIAGLGPIGGIQAATAAACQRRMAWCWRAICRFSRVRRCSS